MFLCERRFSPISFISGSSTRPSTSYSSSSASIVARCGDFEDSLHRHLQTLVPPPLEDNNADVALAFLSRAVSVLTSTYTEAGRLIRDPAISGDPAAVSAYLDISVGILELSNVASAEVDRFLRGRLLLAYSLHLLEDYRRERSGTWRVEKAREAIVEWEKGDGGPESTSNVNRIAVPLSIASPWERDKGRRRLSALGRVVFAVEAVFALVRGILLKFLSPAPVSSAAVTLGISGVPEELAWAGVYRELLTTISPLSDRGHPPRILEIDAVKCRFKELIAAANNGRYPDNNVDVSLGAVPLRDLENAVHGLSHGLEGLAEANRGLFREALRSRDATLGYLRAGCWKKHR